MRKYEIMFIVKPDLEEKTVKDTVKKLEKSLTDNKIKGFKSGFYYLYNVDSNSDAAVKEFDRIASIDENVIRHLVINIEK